jgi:hypothetical protein
MRTAPTPLRPGPAPITQRDYADSTTNERRLFQAVRPTEQTDKIF